MDLVQGYCLTRNNDGTYFIEFNTTAPATVSYREGDTLEIVVNPDAKGETKFKTKSYNSKDGQFKYIFNQAGAAERKTEPGGTTFP
jgi:hypothetical protein